MSLFRPPSTKSVYKEARCGRNILLAFIGISLLHPMPNEVPPPELRKRTSSSSPPGRPEKDVHNLTEPLEATRSHGLRVILALFTGASILAMVTFRRTPNVVSNQLPLSYALCSPEGRIVTVDESNPQAECLVVTGSHFSDVGSLGVHISVYLNAYCSTD